MSDEGKEYITQPAIIAGHLQRLQRSHIFPNISIKGSTRFSKSLFVEIDTKGDFLLLDILQPQSAHNELVKKRDFVLTTQNLGVEYSFKSTVEKVVNADGQPAYYVRFPKTLIYHQRRLAFRAPISREDNIVVTVTDNHDKSCTGMLSNISIGGASIQLPMKDVLPFKMNMRLKSCQFAVGEEFDFDFPAVVRDISEERVHQIVRIGIQFRDIDKAQERTIQQLVLQLERNLIKRNNRE